MYYSSDFSKATEKEQKPKPKKQKKKLNRWSVFGLVALVACLTILYVGNVLQVNTLLKEVRDSEYDLNNLKNENEILRLELNKLQSPERIVSIAEDKLGMIRADKPPKIMNREQ